MSHHGIEWLNRPGTIGRSWNPVTGCSHVSPGCEHCYAEALSIRFGFSKKPWTAANAVENVRLRPDKLMDPWRWKKPSLVFVNSMSDLFHERMPNSYIDAVFAVMAASLSHTFIILTKRSERMRAYMNESARWDCVRHAGEKLKPSRPPQHWYYVSDWSLRLANWPLQNVWLGVSAEDQRRWNERTVDLMATPAAIRLVSAEPLLERIDMTAMAAARIAGGESKPTFDAPVDWIIVGGESGPRARPCDVRWILSLKRQCAEMRIPLFVKQLGSKSTCGDPWTEGQFKDRKCANPNEWPEVLRIREWPTATMMEANQ